MTATTATTTSVAEKPPTSAAAVVPTSAAAVVPTSVATVAPSSAPSTLTAEATVSVVAVATAVSLPVVEADAAPAEGSSPAPSPDNDSSGALAEPLATPFRHLVTLRQLSGREIREKESALRRSGPVPSAAGSETGCPDRARIAAVRDPNRPSVCTLDHRSGGYVKSVGM